MIGKPSAAMFDVALESLRCSRECAVMVGDTPESDIAGAQGAGISSVLVTPEDGEKSPVRYDPPAQAVVRDLGELFETRLPTG